METMKSDTSKIRVKMTALADELRTEPGIPCFELRFRGNPGPDLPLRRKAVNGGISTVRMSDYLAIDYLPRMKLFRIVEQQTEKGKEVVCYVPSDWATFEPMP